MRSGNVNLDCAVCIINCDRIILELDLLCHFEEGGTMGGVTDCFSDKFCKVGTLCCWGAEALVCADDGVDEGAVG